MILTYRILITSKHFSQNNQAYNAEVLLEPSEASVCKRVLVLKSIKSNKK